MSQLLRLLSKKHAELCLIISTVAIMLVPFWGLLQNYQLWILFSIFFLLAVICYYAKAYFDLGLVLIIGVIFISAKLAFPTVDNTTLLFRCGALTAYGLLHGVLLIGPLSRFSRLFRKLYKHRRHLGVTVFLLAAMHASIVFRIFFNYSLPGVFEAIFTFFGFIAFFILSIMALTSWDYLQKHISLKQWYVVYTAVLVGLTGMVYFYYQQTAIVGTYGALFAYSLPVFFLILGVLIAPYSLAKYLFYKINGWKQLHVLVYVAYISLLFHVWVAYVYMQPIWVTVLFWVSASSIAIVHSIGWIVKWREDNYFRNRVKNLNIVTVVDGRQYIGVAKTSEFTEGKGEKFIVNGDQIAVFLFKGEYRAINNVCAHQKGPLYQGKTTPAGYVVCPWHQYAFSLKDGKGPVGYSDCVPTYQTYVTNDIVYVSV